MVPRVFQSDSSSHFICRYLICRFPKKRSQQGINSHSARNASRMSGYKNRMLARSVPARITWRHRISPIHFCLFEHPTVPLHVSFRTRWRILESDPSETSPSTFCVPPMPYFCALSRRSRRNGGRLRNSRQLTSMSELTLVVDIGRTW
jgi:hypothetical protein